MLRKDFIEKNAVSWKLVAKNLINTKRGRRHRAFR